MSQMNILFLMTDQQRYDMVGYVAESKISTPNIDRIAQGCAFTRCQTVNPICQPARTALLTGKYPHQIGTLNMSGDLNFDQPTYPKALQEAGYWTAGIGKFHYLQTWEWSRERGRGVNIAALTDEYKKLGFDEFWEGGGKQLALKNYCNYCETLDQQGMLEEVRDWIHARGSNNPVPSSELDHDGIAWPFGEEHHIDTVIGRKVREALSERPKDRPFFMYGSFCSPHKPFDPPQRFLDMIPYEEEDDFLPARDGVLTESDKKNLWRLRRAYKATLKLVDEEVGKILDQLEEEGVLDQTVVLFTSDHGELMGDHYRVQKSDFYRESLEVPTCVRHPQHLYHQAHSTPIEITDLTATLLDVAGLNPQQALSRDWPDYGDIVPCRSLLPVISREEDAVRDVAFSECSNSWQCVTSERYKFIRFPGGEDPDVRREEFYSLQNDPGEQTNLIDEPELQSAIDWHRRRLFHVLDKTPPMQHRWAPLMD